MLQIESKNKIKLIISDNKGAWIKSEDVMVAAVFGTAFYLPFNTLLGPILRNAEILGGDRGFPVKEIEDTYYAELWPTFKRIKEYDPSLLANDESPRTELDGLCDFGKHLLIIEGKASNVLFDEHQLIKYLNSLSHNSKKKTWLLAVGKGSSVEKKLAQLPTMQDYNLLYIDWTSIKQIITYLAGTIENNTKYLFEDMVNILDNRNLRPFEGFFWPDNIEPIAKKTSCYDVDEEWFPLAPRTWPKQIDSTIKIGNLNNLPW